MLRFFKAFTLFLSIVERKTNNLFLQMRKTFRRGGDVQIKESRIIAGQPHKKFLLKNIHYEDKTEPFFSS